MMANKGTFATQLNSVHLRSLREEDGALLARLMSDTESGFFYRQRIPEDLEEEEGRELAVILANDTDSEAKWLTILGGSDEKTAIGFANVARMDRIHGDSAVELLIDEEYRESRAVSEALDALIGQLFFAEKMHRICAYVCDGELWYGELLTEKGFVREAYRRQRYAKITEDSASLSESSGNAQDGADDDIIGEWELALRKDESVPTSGTDGWEHTAGADERKAASVANERKIAPGADERKNAASANEWEPVPPTGQHTSPRAPIEIVSCENEPGIFEYDSIVIKEERQGLVPRVLTGWLSQDPAGVIAYDAEEKAYEKCEEVTESIYYGAYVKNVPVSFVKITLLNENEGIFTYSIYTEKSARGKGYGGKTLKAVLTYWFEELGMCKLEAYVNTDNEFSRRMMDRLGMTCEGRLREHRRYLGGFHDSFVYGITVDEFEGNKG